MKKSNPDSISAQLTDARAAHETAVTKRDTLAGERAEAERRGAAALRDHASALAEAQVDVDVHARRVTDLEAAEAKAQADEAIARRRDAYARASTMRAAIIEKIEARRSAIAHEVTELRAQFRSAEQAIMAVNLDLPRGAQRIGLAEYALRRGAPLVGPLDDSYWVAGLPRYETPKPPTPVKVDAPAPEVGSSTGQHRSFLSLPWSPKNVEAEAERADGFDPSKRRHLQPEYVS